jgi:hypothetical protein
LISVAILALIAAGVRQFLPAPPIPEGARLRIPTRVGSVTLLSNSHTTPPPWPEGNCFKLIPPLRRARELLEYSERWHVINMHHENFEVLVKQLGLTTIEVEYYGGCCLVTDPRIPRSWLREKPCPGCTSAAVRTAVLSRHADKFRDPAARP